VEMLQELGADLEALGAAGVLAYFWLALADVMRRAGRTADAADALNACIHFAADDPVALAHLNLTRGDGRSSRMHIPRCWVFSLALRFRPT